MHDRQTSRQTDFWRVHGAMGEPEVPASTVQLLQSATKGLILSRKLTFRQT